MTIFTSWNAPTVDDNGDDLTGHRLRFDYSDTSGKILTDSIVTSVTSPEPAYGETFTATLTAKDLNDKYDPITEEASVFINRPPSISISDRTIDTDYTGSTVVFPYRITDENVSEVEVEISFLSGNWSIDTVTKRVTIRRPSGGWGRSGTSYSCTITATDEHSLSRSSDFSLDVELPENDPPVADRDVDLEIEKGKSKTFDLLDYWDDPENDSLTFSGFFQGNSIPVNTDFDAIGISGSSLTIDAGALNLSVGRHNISIRANDGVNSARARGWQVVVLAPEQSLDFKSITITLSPLE